MLKGEVIFSSGNKANRKLVSSICLGGINSACSYVSNRNNSIFGKNVITISSVSILNSNAYVNSAVSIKHNVTAVNNGVRIAEFFYCDIKRLAVVFSVTHYGYGIGARTCVERNVSVCT